MQFLDEQECLVRELEASRVGGWCRVGKGGRPVA